MTIASCGPTTVQQAPQRRAISAAQKHETPQAGNAAEAQADAAQGAEVLSVEEINYFARLYPGDLKEISMHTTYTRSGLAKSGAALGSLIDTKS